MWPPNLAPRKTVVVAGPSKGISLREAVVDFRDYHVGCSETGVHRFEFLPHQQPDLRYLLRALSLIKKCQVERDEHSYTAKEFRQGMICNNRELLALEFPVSTFAYGPYELILLRTEKLCPDLPNSSGDWKQPFACQVVNDAMKSNLYASDEEFYSTFTKAMQDAANLNCGKLPYHQELMNFERVMRDRKQLDWRVVSAEMLSVASRAGDQWTVGDIRIQHGAMLVAEDLQGFADFLSGTRQPIQRRGGEELEDLVLMEMGIEPKEYVDFAKVPSRNGRQYELSERALRNHNDLRRTVSIVGWNEKFVFENYGTNPCCLVCERLFLDPEGMPRSFTAQELLANGTNFGRAMAEWKPTLFPIHLGCTCHLRWIPFEYHNYKTGILALTETGDMDGAMVNSDHNGPNSIARRDDIRIIGRVDLHGDSGEVPDIGSIPAHANAGRLSNRILLEVQDADNVTATNNVWANFIADTRSLFDESGTKYALALATDTLRNAFLFPYAVDQHTVSGAIAGQGASCQARTLLILEMLREIPELVPDQWELGVQVFTNHVQAVLVPVDLDRQEVWDIFSNSVSASRAAPVYAAGVGDSGLVVGAGNVHVVTAGEPQIIRPAIPGKIRPTPSKYKQNHVYSTKKTQFWPAGQGHFPIFDTDPDWGIEAFSVGPPAPADVDYVEFDYNSNQVENTATVDLGPIQPTPPERSASVEPIHVSPKQTVPIVEIQPRTSQVQAAPEVTVHSSPLEDSPAQLTNMRHSPWEAILAFLWRLLGRE
jgi:hypothetical protein